MATVVRAKSLLTPPPARFYNFIDYIEQTTFGIACDAQANFKVRYELCETADRR